MIIERGAAMYCVQFEGRTVYAEFLTYAKQVSGKWIRASEADGQALFIDGVLCNVKGKENIEGLPQAAISNVDAGQVLAQLLTRLQVAVEKLELTQDALCDLSVDIEDTKEALCDLSLEVESNG